MATTSLLIVLLVTAATTLAQKQCCYPDQFEGSLGTILATVDGGTGSARTDGFQFAYDYPNRRVAAIEYKQDMGELTEFQYIYEYSKGVEYDIEIKSQVSICTRLEFDETMPHCIPTSATYLGSSYFGDHKFNVDFFQFFEMMSPTTYANVSLTVSQGDCIPVSIVTEGKQDNVPTLFVRGFSNYTSGISDPSKYFTVPSFCPQANDEPQKIRKPAFHKIL